MAVHTTVVVVSYRPGEWLAPCVESALAQTSDVVVVDNGSAGAAASSVARSLGARAIRSPVNLGFAGGANLGFRAAGGELVGLLNDDATAGPGWLEAAEDALTDPSVAAVTPKVLLSGPYVEVALDDEPWLAPGDARPLGRMLRSVTVGGAEMLPRLVGAGIHRLEWTAEGRARDMWRWTAGRVPFYVPLPDHYAGEPVLVDGEDCPTSAPLRVVNHAGSFLGNHGGAGEIGLGAPDDGRFDTGAERFGFSGTAPVFRAATLRRLGGFAIPFFAYNEDTDWCLRARLADMRILYDPRAVVSHRLSATSGGPLKDRVVYLTRRNALLCLARNAPASVARPQLLRSIRHGSGGGVRRGVVLRLPWALSSRLAMRRLWVRSPEEVWAAWTGRDSAWDVSPSRSDGDRGV